MKKKVTVFLHWRKYSWDDEVTYKPWPCDMSGTDSDTALIGEYEMEFDIPDNFDPRPIQVEVLKEKRKEILAEMGKKVTEIDERINSLLALENHSEQGR